MLKKNGGSTSELSSSCNLPAPLPEASAVLTPALHKAPRKEFAEFKRGARQEKTEIGIETRLAVGGLGVVGAAGVFAAGVAAVVGGTASAVATPLIIAVGACYLAKKLLDGAKEDVFLKTLHKLLKRQTWKGTGPELSQC